MLIGAADLDAPVTLVRSNDIAYVAMESLSGGSRKDARGPLGIQCDGGLEEIASGTCLRSASGIQAAMTADLTGLESGLVAYWRLNEGTGVTGTDDSPLHHPAMLAISPLWVAGQR